MEMGLFNQLLSFAGALLILVAYVGHQLKWLKPRSAVYNVLNALGSGILGYIALRPFQAGFVVLEFVWAGISLYALTKAFRDRDHVSFDVENGD
jgi:hypothetical protein